MMFDPNEIHATDGLGNPTQGVGVGVLGSMSGDNAALIQPGTPQSASAATGWLRGLFGGKQMTVVKGVDVALSPHGMTVSVSSTMITAAIIGICVYLATKGGVAMDDKTVLGLAGAAGGAWKLFDMISGSNAMTKQALGAK